MFKKVFGRSLYRQIICKMLVLLLTFAVLFGVGFGQSSDTACPTLKEVHSSQEALASQLRDVLAKYNQQQSSESLTNLMQLMLVKQIMAEMDLNTPAGGEGTTGQGRRHRGGRGGHGRPSFSEGKMASGYPYVTRLLSTPTFNARAYPRAHA